MEKIDGYTNAIIEHLNGKRKHTLAEYQDCLEANADLFHRPRGHDRILRGLRTVELKNGAAGGETRNQSEEPVFSNPSCRDCHVV
jgi:hypothetical protein